MTKPILVNVTEEIVHGLVRFFLYGHEYQTFCNCEFCELEIVADVLNHLSPSYVSTTDARDEVFKTINTPKNIEAINKQIIQSIYTVGKAPNHKEES